MQAYIQSTEKLISYIYVAVVKKLNLSSEDNFRSDQTVV